MLHRADGVCLFVVWLPDGGTMKTLLVLLLLCLSDPGHSDCQEGCLSCSHLLPRHLTFNTMVRSTHTHIFSATYNVTAAGSDILAAKLLISATSEARRLIRDLIRNT